MRLKSEGQGEDQIKMGSDTKCCPVCKQFLPKEESLHEHLNSHPKEQVIEALIQLKDACEDFKPSGSAQGRSSASIDGSSREAFESSTGVVITPIIPASDEQQNVISVGEKPTSPSLVIQPCAPSILSSHLVQSPVAQFIHVPVVTSATPNLVSGSSSSSQAPVVLYSPFVCPPSSSEAVSSHDSNGSRPLQFITNKNLIRTPFSIIQAQPSKISQVESLALHLEVKAEGSSGSSILKLGSHGVQQTADSEQENTSTEWHAPVSDDPPSPVCSEAELIQVGNKNDPCESLKLGEKSSVQEHVNIEKNLYVILRDKDNEDFDQNKSEDFQVTSSGPQSPSLIEPRTSQERDMLSPPKKRRCSDWSSLGSPGIPEGSPNGNIFGSPRSSNWNMLGSPGAHSSSSVEGVLRVRSDLSVSAASHSALLSGEENSDNWPMLPLGRLKQEVKQMDDSSTDEASCTDSNFDEHASNHACDFPGPTNVVNEILNIQPSHFLAEPDISICDDGKQGSLAIKSADDDSSELNAVSTEDTHEGHDELRYITPDVAVSFNEDYQDDGSSGRPGSPLCDSMPPSPYQKSLESPSTPLNIQTDETMPPRGELSEQESMGGNSSSMWSVPVYHISRQLPSPVVSYDLTARESWPGSDISDSQGNAADNHTPQCFTTAPSFSNTLHPFIPRASADASFVSESPFSSHLQPQSLEESNDASKIPNNLALGNSSKGSIKKSSSENGRVRKAPAKPRVYRCKECSIVFSTQKLRRLHPCEQLKSSDDALTVMRMTTDVKGQTEDLSVPGSSSREENLGVQSKPKKKTTRKPKATIKKEVILDDQSSGQASFGEQYRISKTEPEDISDPRVNPSIPSELSTTEDYQSSTFEPASNDVTFVEVPLKHEAVQAALFGELQCQTCSEDFKTAKQLSQHMASKHKIQKYQCATCGDTFDKERSYYDHLMIHPSECQLCGKTFERRKYLALHMKWHMEVKPHKCDACAKTFVTKQKLDEHMNSHTGNAPIKCSDCDKTFKRYSNMIQHRNRYHLNLKPKTKDYVCHCGEVLPTKKKLEWHKEIHDVKPKSCQYCGLKFIHTVSLTRHVRKAHDRRYVPSKDREGENIECPVCHLVFLKSSLATHIKIHTGERHPCHICGKDFTTKWNLQLHRWTHASRSSKPFKCTLCKASFCRKPDYISHMHSHRNIRPYTCNFCGCQFGRKYNCVRHMREHEEGKNFTCTICNKTFHRSYYLKDHMRVHSGTRPFTCHICGKASTSKSNHNKHVRIHHAREPQNTEI